MKTHLVALTIGISLVSHGASVQWNCMKITCADGVNRISVGTYDFAYPQEIWPEIGIEISKEILNYFSGRNIIDFLQSY